MPRCLLVCAALFLVVSATANAGTIYKWTDSDGGTHYGQLPPDDVEAVPLDTGPASPEPPPPSAADDTVDEPEPAPDSEMAGNEGAQTSRQQIEQACDAYRENLAVLEDPAVRRIQVGDGEVVVLDEEERSRRIAETQSFIDDWCE